MLKTYMIGYDLNSPGQGYDELIKTIKTLGTWWHCLDSTWLIKSSKTAVEIRDILTPHLDANDELLVAKLSGEAAWRGFNKQCADWLRENL
ncbi:SinR family protein [Hymenobacter rigui]|uniref:SinR family protein n=1 Tax=Hymenobacter rigui TaxID=334424 RepID=A0A3R9VAI1_9BACT|nr:SinR family protein [Hymenobacter rigui]RSK50111.1 SinR family protein [Hymenobacter rigui]